MGVLAGLEAKAIPAGDEAKDPGGVRCFCGRDDFGGGAFGIPDFERVGEVTHG
jgi:hypothetical protein